LRIKRLFPMLALPAALAAVVLASTTTSAVAGGSLTGAGSTLVAPFVENVFAPDFQSSSGTSVTYGSVGSGAGITDISNKTVDFGASDAPLTSAQDQACTGCVEIPWALGATGLSYNLAGVSHLNLSGPVIAEIYLGQITNWDDPAIAALNKGETLPNEKITPVWRSDGSGDTYVFTSFLSKVSPAWASKVGAATAVTFPVGTGGKGNSGVAAVVSSTPGAIGNNSWFYIREDGLKAVSVENGAGNFEQPYEPNLVAAATLLKSVPSLNTLSRATRRRSRTTCRSSTRPTASRRRARSRRRFRRTRRWHIRWRPSLRHRPSGRRQHLDAEAVHRVRADRTRAEEGHRRLAPVRAAAERDRRGGHQGSQRALTMMQSRADD
jgi:phosphate transport system substrate-binding protein